METMYKNMQIVPEKFSQYTIERTTELNTLVKSGVATADSIVAGLINGTPEGGRFITVPFYNPLEGDDDVFSESDVTVGDINTSAYTATLLMRQKAWGATDLAQVLGGSDPMSAVGNQVADWWLTKEQAIYLSILKGILDPVSGALKSHVNDVSGAGTKTITMENTLDTKQLLGDHYKSLGMVFMHSATYTYLQKNDMITRTPVFDPTGNQVELESYLGYRIIVDDAMPATVTDAEYTKTTDESVTPGKTYYTLSGSDYVKVDDPQTENIGDYYEMTDAGTVVYDTYFLGTGAFIRQDGTPNGFIGTETDRDKLGAKDYLINRRCMVIHPRGLSWNVEATYPEGIYYPTNKMLATPANWKLAINHKKVPIACLRHTIA